MRLVSSAFALTGCLKSIAFILIATQVTNAALPTTDWMRIYGGSQTEKAEAVALNGLGSVYFSGSTESNLSGLNRGGSDVFVTNYSTSGIRRWTRQIGTAQEELSGGVVADSTGVYVAGTTRGDLTGQSAGGQDVFLAKYSNAGALLWMEQFGTPSGESFPTLTIDRLGSVFVSGNTAGMLGESDFGGTDVFLSKFAPDGSMQWARQFGSEANDINRGVSADGRGNVYLVGWSSFTPGHPSAHFVTKFDDAGNQHWTVPLVSNLTLPPPLLVPDNISIFADARGNVFVAGFGQDYPISGSEQGFLTCYDSNGNVRWTRELTFILDVYTLGISADNLGNAYVTGTTNGSLFGRNAGQYDMFAAKFDQNGNQVWGRQWGTDLDDTGDAAVFDNSRSLYIAGGSYGDFGGFNAGQNDAILLKLRVIPEPASRQMALLGVAWLSGICIRSIPRRRFQKS